MTWSVGDIDLAEVTKLVGPGYILRMSSGAKALLIRKETSWNTASVSKEPELQIGQEVHVKVLKTFGDQQWFGGRVLVSTRALLPDPWLQIESLYPVGTRFRARVSKLTTFGALFFLPGGVSMLLHRSELSWSERPHKALEMLSVGQLIEVIVNECSGVERRLSCSHRALFPDPWVQVGELFAVGSVVTGEISKLKDFGAFVQIAPGVQGLLHRTEAHNLDSLAEGDRLSVKILDFDLEAKRISLGQLPD